MQNVKEYFGACYSAGKISEGEIVPVGGNMLSEEMEICIQADFSHFENLFTRVREIAQSADPEVADKQLASLGIQIPAHDFLPLYAFNVALGELYPDISSNVKQRQAAYSDGQTLILSEVVEKGMAACAEIALLAQKSLENLGRETRYMSGSMLANRQKGIPEMHSFVAIERKSDVLFYDPANMTLTPNGAYPTIYPVTKESLQKMESSNQPCFLMVRNAVDGGEAGYGVGGCYTVWPEECIENASAVPKNPLSSASSPKPPQAQAKVQRLSART